VRRISAAGSSWSSTTVCVTVTSTGQRTGDKRRRSGEILPRARATGPRALLGHARSGCGLGSGRVEQRQHREHAAMVPR
jgi:hypothetical protein